MMTFGFEIIIVSEKFTCLFTYFISFQEVDLVYYKAIDDTYVFYSFQHAKISFCLFQQLFRFFCGFLPF